MDSGSVVQQNCRAASAKPSSVGEDRLIFRSPAILWCAWEDWRLEQLELELRDHTAAGRRAPSQRAVAGSCLSRPVQSRTEQERV